MSETTINDEQQFCLRWNNFQANITSQFEALRDDEDFTDVTIACDGKRLQAHRVVLSACSPFFKELFKTNPCSHPIIFMRDVEACHIQALMEFMYAGEVNVAQAHLSGFLKTAESLKIRGLTDTTTNERIIKQQQKGETFKTITTNFNDNNSNNDANKSKLIDNNSNNDTNSLQQQQPITSSHQDITNITAPTTITTTPAPPPPPPPLLTSTIITPTATTKISSPPPKRQCKSDSDLSRLKQIKSIDNTSDNNLMLLNTFNIQQQQHDNHNHIELSNIKAILQPKLELPDYLSDDDNKELGNIYATPADVTELAGGMEIIPQMSTYSSSLKETTQESVQPNHTRIRKKRPPNHWSYLSRKNSREPPDSPTDEDRDNHRKNRLIKLGEGIEIYEDQLRSVKWNDYRKLTRGLATILFSPAELATCSVTGQRWSRAGNNERPVKPALDRSKVQAIISYVATRFPMVEISRIKQVLAYKCKENSTAFRMKAVRYYEDQQLK